MRGIGPQLRRGLAVVAERTVAALDRRAHAPGLGGLDEVERFRGVAHQAVKYAAQGLRGCQAHVLVGLVDDQLHRAQLREGDGRQLARALGDLALEA